MKIPVYSQEGKELNQTLLPKDIFDVKANPDLIHQVAISQMANRRKVIAHTKMRSEVSGGGKKPWRQKGTGRARHGSTRSPIWRHGGIAFGPRKERVFKKKINRKMKRKALFMVLSAKAKNNLLFVLDALDVKEAKTKVMAGIMSKLPLKGSALLALPKFDKNVFQAVKNLPNVSAVEARNLNVLDLLSSKYLIIPRESIKVIKENFLD